MNEVKSEVGEPGKFQPEKRNGELCGKVFSIHTSDCLAHSKLNFLNVLGFANVLRLRLHPSQLVRQSIFRKSQCHHCSEAGLVCRIGAG